MGIEELGADLGGLSSEFRGLGSEFSPLGGDLEALGAEFRLESHRAGVLCIRSLAIFPVDQV